MTLPSKASITGRIYIRNVASTSTSMGRHYHIEPDLSASSPADMYGLLTTQAACKQQQQPILRSDTQSQKNASGFFTPSLPRKLKQAPSTSFRPSGSASSAADVHSSTSGRMGRISDHEYSVRVGQAYDLLRATIPDFLRIGLVDYDDARPSSSSAPSSMNLFDTLALRSLRANAEEEDSKRQREIADAAAGSSSTSPSSSSLDEEALSSIDALSDAQRNLVYHPKIQFRFCAGHRSEEAPSSSDITDAEAASLSFSGRSLYFASAHALRHTLNLLFSDPKVEVERIRLEKRGRGAVWSDGASTSDAKASSSIRGPRPPKGSCGLEGSTGGDAIHLRVRFTGHLRLTNVEHRYTLVFRYDIDGETGRIALHTVERIEPAIGRKLWTVINTVWDRITGQATRMPDPTPIPAPCVAHVGRVTTRYQSRGGS